MSKETFINDIEHALRKLDLAKRPYIIFLNPKDAEDLKNQIPEIEDSLVIQPIDIIERGKGYLMKRESIEQWDLPIKWDSPDDDFEMRF